VRSCRDAGGRRWKLSIPQIADGTALALRGQRRDGKLLSHEIVEGARREKSGFEMKFIEPGKSRH
jgi:hypothetical protein